MVRQLLHRDLLRLQLVGVDARLELPKLDLQLLDLHLLLRDALEQVALPALHRLEVVHLHHRHLAHLQEPLQRDHALQTRQLLLLNLQHLLLLLIRELVLHLLDEQQVDLRLLHN